MIKSEKNYLKHIKQSGYRSYHLIIYYTVETSAAARRNFRRKSRSVLMAMNFWATIEHSLQYKYKGDMPPACGRTPQQGSRRYYCTGSWKCPLSAMRSWMHRILLRCSPILSKDILLSIENLYKISNKREVEKIQDEFLRVFRTKDLQQLARFHRQLDIIAEGYRAQSVSF